MRIACWTWMLAACAAAALGIAPAIARETGSDADWLLAGGPQAAADADPPPDCTAACGCDPCCGDEVCCDGLFGGLIAPSNHHFSDLISPMTNPVYFEDPRTLTEVRFIYIHHQVPSEALGGEINLVAAQLRAALSDRLSLIATKDGFITSSNPLIRDGWADLSLGLKYNLLADCDCQRILSVGAVYELPVGSRRAQQGNGDGLFNLLLSGGREFGNGNHWLSCTGLLLPTDDSQESTLWFWSNHVDRRLGTSGFYVLAECNWYHYLESGDRFSLAPIEGGDLFNLGSTDVAGNDIVTGAIGLKYKPGPHLELGLAWELPLTEREDVLDNRLTFDCILRY